MMSRVKSLMVYHTSVLSLRFDNVINKTMFQVILKCNVIAMTSAQNVNSRVFLFECWSNVSRRHFEVYKPTFVKIDSKLVLVSFIDKKETSHKAIAWNDLEHCE